MHFKSARLRFGVAIALILSALAPVQAAFVSWTNSNGANAVISWSGGGSTDGLWGDPVISGLNFNFTPDQFALSVSNGNAGTLDSRLEFNLDVLNGEYLTSFTINETGLYSILGGGSVQAVGLLIIQDRDTLLQYTAPLITNPAFPQATAGNLNGTWSGQMQVILPQDVQIYRATIIADNALQATSNTGGTAYIDKKLMPAGAGISNIIPEPSALCLLLAGVPVLMRRRK